MFLLVLDLVLVMVVRLWGGRYYAGCVDGLNSDGTGNGK